MGNEQRIENIRTELQRLASAKESGAKVDVWNLLKILGVDERIINNPNPNDLGMGIDFDSYIQALKNANITIKDDGSVSMKTDIGNTYLVKEGKNLGGIEINLFVKDGEFHMSTAYKTEALRGKRDQFDMIVVPYGNDYAVRTRTAEYTLESEFDRTNNKYDTRGSGICTVSDFDKNGIELQSSRVSYGNKPEIGNIGYNGFDLETVRVQENCARDYTYGCRELEDINPAMSCADKNSAFCYGETMARRMDSVDRVQVATWNNSEKKWDWQYHLALTGEYNMAKIFNNSGSYASEEELNEVRQQRLEEGWFDRKIEEYRQKGGTTATTIANQLEQEKLKLEETKGRSL